MRLMIRALAVILMFCPFFGLSQDAEDVNNSTSFSKKFKDDDVLCFSSYRYFTFDNGKNALGDKVVEVQEDAEYEFLSLKKFASITYAEFYNKFVELNSFKRAYKVSNKKYLTSSRVGIDRSVTDDGIFFDDSRMQFYPLRFSKKGEMARVTVKKTYTDGKYRTRLFFHAPYPVKEQVIKFKVPDWINVDFKKMNFEGHQIQMKQTKISGAYYKMLMSKEDNVYPLISDHAAISIAFRIRLGDAD